MLNSNIKNEKEFKEATTCVIVFFDLFDYPLTAYEVWKYLNKRVTLNEVIDVLDDLRASGTINKENGFFFLPERREILTIRSLRHNYSLRKIKIARRFTGLFKIFPFVRAVILANSYGQNNMRDGSDIDFLIITAPKRLWLTRLFCTGIAKLTNSRPTEKNKRDKICLSFYLSAENMNLDEFKLAESDPAFFYWLRSFILLYNKDNTYEQFLADNKLFLDVSVKSKNNQFLSKSNFLNYLEKLAARLQLAIMSQPLKKAVNNSDGVVINNRALKLYLHDRRREYAEKYGNRLRQVFTENN
jgi:hypothetical protein